MAKPSVLMFNRVYPPVRGASGRVMRDLARGLSAAGWHVTVVTTGPQAGRGRDGAVRIVRIKAGGRPRSLFAYGFIWLRLLLAGARMKRRDLVITLSDPPMLAVAGQMVAQMRGSRHIHWCHDLYPDLLPALDVPMPEAVMRRLRERSLRALRQCDRVVVVGRCMARRLIRQGIPARRISVIPNWPDGELVTPRRNAAANAANANDGLGPELLASSAQKFRVLYSGTMGKAHPLETIIEAARLLNATHPEIEFVFVGDGAGHERLVRARDRQGLENIRLIPWQPVSRLRGLMESGDLHLVSMAHEAAGMLVPCKLYSAFAVGRPCILVGPSHCEAARTILDFGAGVVVPQGEAEILAETIRAYRHNSADWFAAQDGAKAAGAVYRPDEAIAAWIKRAAAVVGVRGTDDTGKGLVHDAFNGRASRRAGREAA